MINVDEREKICVLWVAEDLCHMTTVVEKPVGPVPFTCHGLVPGCTVKIAASVFMSSLVLPQTGHP